MTENREIELDVAGEYVEEGHLIRVVFSSPDLENCKAEVQFTIDHDAEVIFAFVASINEGVKQVLRNMLAEIGLYPEEKENKTPGTE